MQRVTQRVRARTHLVDQQAQGRDRRPDGTERRVRPRHVPDQRRRPIEDVVARGADGGIPHLVLVADPHAVEQLRPIATLRGLETHLRPRREVRLIAQAVPHGRHVLQERRGADERLIRPPIRDAVREGEDLRLEHRGVRRAASRPEQRGVRRVLVEVLRIVLGDRCQQTAGLEARVNPPLRRALQMLGPDDVTAPVVAQREPLIAPLLHRHELQSKRADQAPRLRHPSQLRQGRIQRVRRAQRRDRLLQTTPQIDRVTLRKCRGRALLQEDPRVARGITAGALGPQRGGHEHQGQSERTCSANTMTRSGGHRREVEEDSLMPGERA